MILSEWASSQWFTDSNDLIGTNLLLTIHWFKLSDWQKSPINNSLIQMILSEWASSQQFTDSSDPIVTNHLFKLSCQGEPPANDLLKHMTWSEQVSS